MQIRLSRSLPALLSVFLASSVPASADVRITMRDGRVSLKATNATVREILAEWAKVGQARIINGERITGAPITIELTDVAEGQALDVLLRTVAGYMAAPRPTALPNAAQFDRILILPTSTPPRVTAVPPQPAVAQQPRPVLPQQPPQLAPAPQGDDPDGPVPVLGPVFNTFPQPGQPGAVLQPGQAVAAPFAIAPVRGTNAPPPGTQMPIGVAVPGMVAQPPPQPGQPVPPPQDR